jgi:hypothetical protein
VQSTVQSGVMRLVVNYTLRRLLPIKSAQLALKVVVRNCSLLQTGSSFLTDHKHIS